MRILIVHSIYRPYKKGGAEVVVEKFVDELKKKHDVVVLTTKPFDGFCSIWRCHKPEVTREDGVTVVRFAPINLFTIHSIEQRPFWMRVIWNAVDVWNIYSWIVMKWALRKYQPDMVWTHTMKGIGYLAMKTVNGWKHTQCHREEALRRGDLTKAENNHQGKITSQSVAMTDKRWILTPHNEEYVYQFGYGLPPFKIGLVERVTMLFTRWFTRGPDLIFSPSKQIQDFYRELGFWKGIPGKWDWPAFLEKRDTRHETRDMNKLPFTFGFLGQLEEHKGVRLLIEAFKTYPDQNVRLLVAGRGGLAEYVREEACKDPRIEFFGEYTSDQLEALFGRISVLVVPSTIRDNMPTVILESFSYGRPVIGSNLGGIPEALAHGKGILLKGFEEKDFHEAFDRARSPDVYSKLVQAVSEWKPFTIKESLERIGL